MSTTIWMPPSSNHPSALNGLAADAAVRTFTAWIRNTSSRASLAILIIAIVVVVVTTISVAGRRETEKERPSSYV
nr:unnamed protein product [Digitaria exilis]